MRDVNVTRGILIIRMCGSRQRVTSYPRTVIFFNLPLLFSAPIAFAILIAAFAAALLTGLIFHEFCHALMADVLGDRTPRRLGRLTLDLRAHYDPFWTTAIFLFGFGMAKPVPVDPRNTRNPKLGLLLIAAAGPVSNLMVAAIAAIPLRLGLFPLWTFYDARLVSASMSAADLVGLFLGTLVLLNIQLGVFNLLPIPPLDGSSVLAGLLPRELERQYARLQPWGFGLLMLLISAPFLTNGAFGLSTIIGPPTFWLLRLVLGA